MELRLRFLLDTNVLIPLQDSYQILEANLTDFIRLAGIGGHQLLYHPATVADFLRDKDINRQKRNLNRLAQYSQIDQPAPCPWNTPETTENDVCDNEILFALACDAVHALVTEDQGIHAKARNRGLSHRVYTIQTAQHWLRRLHEPKTEVLPNIEDVPLHSLTPNLDHEFFNSLREGYSPFNEWFRTKASAGRRAWTYMENDILAAICIYAIQNDEVINDAQEILSGRSLKLCTFKVGETVRGRKIGELFLKAAFKYATSHQCENIFIHTDQQRHDYLIRLLEDFGFSISGHYNGDVVMVKKHPTRAPEPNDSTPVDYVRKYFPHFMKGEHIQKFIVPIVPAYHTILFPDYIPKQNLLFLPSENVGNAIKLAYLCCSQTNSVRAGDLLLFYRTEDEQCITTIGVVEDFQVLQDPAKIASLVSRRTVYSHEEIERMATKKTKVILFRCVEHLSRPVTYNKLQRECNVAGPIQSIRKISDDQFSKLLTAAGR